MENNIPQAAWEMVAPNIAQDDSTTNIQGFYTLQNQEQEKQDTTDALSHDNTKNTTYIVYVVCKSSKKAGYEFPELLQTCTQLEHTSTPDSHVQ